MMDHAQLHTYLVTPLYFSRGFISIAIAVLYLHMHPWIIHYTCSIIQPQSIVVQICFGRLGRTLVEVRLFGPSEVK